MSQAKSVSRTICWPAPRFGCITSSRYPHPPTEMLLPFVRCRPYDTPLYGLLPNMSESSGTPGENRARGSFASVFP